MSLVRAEGIRDLWISIFNRRGKNGIYTRLFRNLDHNHRSELISMSNLQDDEIPIIGGIVDLENWMIMTSERIVWCANGKFEEIRVDNIRDVRANFSKIKCVVDKINLSELTIIDDKNRLYTLSIEAGSSMIGVWSIIINIVIRNKK